MATKVVENNEISLNGVYYPLVAPVQSSLASIYPGKIVIGDTTKDSQTRTSIIAWSNFQGGVGVNRMEGAGDVGRAWWSTCQLRYKNHLVMGGLVTQTAAVSHGLSNATIGAIGELSDEVYAAWNGSASESPKLYKYNNTTDSWGSQLTTYASGSANMIDQVTDTVTWTATNDTTYLVFAHYDANGSGYSYSSNGTTWITDTQDAKFLTVWDDRLWGIDNTGQLWSSITIGTETTDAKIPLPDGYVTGMFVARDAGGEPIIYVSTKKGIFAHDSLNQRFLETQLSLPFHPDAGKGAIRWRDSVYVPSGLGIYKYINGANAAVVTIMGPDRDDGLPKDKRGSITKMAATHNELLVAVDATNAPITITDSEKLPYQWSSHQGSEVIDAGYSSILGWDERGWETKWLSSSAGRSVTSLTVNNSYNDYRMWWGFSDNVYFMTVPSNIINPSEVGNFEYAETGVHETPWVNAGQSEVDKLAINMKVEVQGASSSETIAVSYAIDYSESYESMGTITSNGTTTYTFDDDNDNPVGVTFRAIKFKLSFARATGLTNKLKSPDVVSMTLEFRKKLSAKWGHQARIDLNKNYKGKSSRDLRSALVSAIESTTLVEFTYRDDSGGTRNYYVDIVSASGVEGTGYDERGMSTVNLVEP
tara:strand:- start:5 stop:1945 length:1941 start_codon:yes stop_codon:yes gene_type:complete